MSEEHKNLSKPKPKRAPTLYFIVGFKLLKGLTALLVAYGAISMENRNLPEDFRKLLEFLHLDPEKKFFVDLADRINDITTGNLQWVAAGAVVYGLFMLLQGVGLAFRVSWAVWLVIGESAFFIPVEIFDLIHKHTPSPENRPHIFAHPQIGVAVLLVANVAIVWYLFKNRDRLVRHYRH